MKFIEFHGITRWNHVCNDLAFSIKKTSSFHTKFSPTTFILAEIFILFHSELTVELQSCSQWSLFICLKYFVKNSSRDCINYRTFTKFSSAKFLWKSAVSTEFWTNRPKLCKKTSTKFSHQETAESVYCSTDKLKMGNRKASAI